jgi:hypothetical protein
MAAADARPVALTAGRRRALAVLVYARRNALDVCESNMTTPAQRFTMGNLSVYWSTAKWLTEQGLAVYAGRNQSGWQPLVQITDAGIELAEAQDL